MTGGELWGSEHGPRGGDEINLLLPGRNYGWPLFSLGLDYDGTPVEYGKDLGVEFELSDIEQPVVDLTPSPAVSSFIISDSDQFPEWKGDYLVGSLKARSLFRVEIEDNLSLVNTRRPLKSTTYDLLEFRAKEGQTPLLWCVYSCSSSRSALGRYGPCVGAGRTW